MSTRNPQLSPIIVRTEGVLPAIRMFTAGGATSSADWIALAAAAREHADDNVYLTDMSTVELRGVRDVDGALALLAETSIHPCSCRIVAQPLSARARNIAADLALGLPATVPAHVSLIVQEESAAGSDDLEVIVASNSYDQRSVFKVRNGDSHRGEDVSQVVEHLLRLADSTDEPQVSENDDDEANGRGAGSDNVSALQIAPTPKLRPIGWLSDHTEPGNVELGAGVAGGILSADLAELLGRMGVPITVTAARSIVIHGLGEGDADVVVRVLAPRGFIFDENSPLL